MEKVEKVGLANIFHDNFHCFWWLEASKPSEAIVPEIMETVLPIISKIFCYQIHGIYWFQGRKHSKNLGQWGGGTRYFYTCIYLHTYFIYVFIEYTYVYMSVSVSLSASSPFARGPCRRPPLRPASGLPPRSASAKPRRSLWITGTWYIYTPSLDYDGRPGRI